MATIRTILVPVDFSDHSSAATDYAVDIAKVFGAKIHLLHAYHVPAQIAMPGEMVIPPDLRSGLRDSAARKMEKTSHKVSEGGVEVATTVVEGLPSQTIIDAAESMKADLIVMGTRGLSGLKHVLLGSVAERVLRLAPCPVLTVRGDDS
jgi:nucleotide-binding universal stress UspA family protein